RKIGHGKSEALGMNLTYPKLRTMRVALDAFSRGLDKQTDAGLIPDMACDSYNFRLSSGALTDGFGIDELTVGGENKRITSERPYKIYCYKRYDDLLDEYDDRLLVYTKSKKLYELRLSSGEGFTLLNKTFATPPKAVNYKLNGVDVMIFSTETGLTVYDGETFTDYESPSITSMCLHAERLFITSGGEGTTLWFSENFDPTNWYVSLTKAGFIDFQDGLGKVNCVVEYGGYVYVFRDYGITRVGGYFDQTEFFADNVDVNRDRIFSGTVASTGNFVLYLTSDGFYRFDGSGAYPVMRGLKNALSGIDNEDATAVYHDGRYYCSLKVRIGDKVERRVLCYDVTGGDFYLSKGFQVSDMVSAPFFGGMLLFAVDGFDRVGVLSDKARLFNMGLEKYWVNNVGDFGVEKPKIMSKIGLSSKGSATVRIKSENGERTIFVKPCDLKKTYPVGLHGVNFQIEFFSIQPLANVGSVSFELKCQV
ncbi:MAG: hypothetical protein ILP02_02410, partial [Clostridia bacterium]|nr:hypothetical protein [Clostridia bacterium]